MFVEREMVEFISSKPLTLRDREENILRHLQIAEESGKEALAELQQQREQLRGVERNQAAMGEDLKVSEKQVDAIGWWGVNALWSFNLGIVNPFNMPPAQEGDEAAAGAAAATDPSASTEVPRTLSDWEVLSRQASSSSEGKKEAGGVGAEGEGDKDKREGKAAQAQGQAQAQAGEESGKLGGIRKMLSVLHETGSAIGQELDEQNEQLKRISNTNDNLHARMKRTSGKVQKELQSKVV